MSTSESTCTISNYYRMDKSKTGFMDLPGEIRNKIYKLLLVIPPVHAPRKLGSDERVYPLPLLLLCKQIHTEGIDILYGQNTFIAHPTLLCSMPRLRHYYGTITSAYYTSLITRYWLRVRLDCDPQFTAHKAISAFNSCKEVTIEPWQAQFGSCDFHVLRLFENVRGVRKARISGSTSAFHDYAIWLEKSMMTESGQPVEKFVGTHEQEELKVVGGAYDTWVVSS